MQYARFVSDGIAVWLAQKTFGQILVPNVSDIRTSDATLTATRFDIGASAIKCLLIRFMMSLTKQIELSFYLFVNSFKRVLTIFK